MQGGLEGHEPPVFDHFALIEVSGLTRGDAEGPVDLTPRAVFHYSTVPDAPLDGDSSLP